MGWLRRLLGGSARTKEDLVRELAKARIADDPTAEIFGATPSTIEGLPPMVLMGLPEATIVTIVETYLTGRAQGLPEHQVFELMEAHRSMVAHGDPPQPCDLMSYIKYRVEIEHGHGAPIPVSHIEH